MENANLGASTYNLQPAENDLTPGQFMEDPRSCRQTIRFAGAKKHTDTETLMQNK
ncbi:hypothetical protein CHS0354_006339 [Potamilus streckersoni]|uniref:Uncharacterized protein n=1 Tax=Potamilus streckersoni TaxID=2493646 RepID=A0AAE0S372_9BIVA|nr:hypothetical protein CHS0354_006339 [Potamilus streckersoni]